MAQHIPIIQWINEKWYPDMIKQIQKVVKETTETLIKKGKVHYASASDNIRSKFITVNKNVEVLPDDYLWKERLPYDYKVLLYRPNEKFDMLIDDETQIKVNHCSFEIHLDKENKILEVFVPL